MIRLTKNQILLLQKILIQKFGGISGIRDEKLFDSAVETPFQTFSGQSLYPSITEKAARIGYGLIKNHPFLDGNKRIGLHAMLVFLKANNFSLNCTDSELIKIIFGVADNSITYEKFLNWLEAHINEN